MIDAGELRFRSARLTDAPAIARLHAESWRRHYRGAYSDAFLDAEVDQDRLAVWLGRLGATSPEAITIVAERDGAIVGFAHCILDQDLAWGSFLDNLHVAHGLKRRRIGARLLAGIGQTVVERASTPGLSLWVLEQNTDAQAFYAARGGTCVGRAPASAPGGDPSRLNGAPVKLRYAWSDASRLLT